MANSRPPQLRKQPVAGPSSSTQKSVINLAEWESKTALGAEGTKSVAALKEACEITPLPPKFQDTDTDLQSSTPVPRLKPLLPGTPTSRPGTPSTSISNINRQDNSLYWNKPIATPEQFHDWFSKLERTVLRSQEAHFHDHLHNVSSHLDNCNHLLQNVDNIDGELINMLEGWRSVEESGRTLKDDCERVLQEKGELEELSEEISSRLDYFQELEVATRILNRPGESLVLNPDFLLMTERVDICLDFLKSHRQYREADLYILRYQQCLTRAMTLIQIYFVNILRSATADIQKRLSDKELSDTARTHLLYTKFRSIASPVATLLAELERRVQTQEGDLNALLSECQTAYCQARRTLLSGKVTEDIRGLDPVKTELVSLTQAGCGYLKQLCTDEFQLYKLFFNSGEQEFYVYLENLCDYLYDDLRPRILHEQRVQTLCNTCTVIQALMVDADDHRLSLSDSSSAEEDSDDNELELQVQTSFDMHPSESHSNRHSQPYALRRLRVGHLLQLILQDAQTRLVFRTQAVIQGEVRYYTPKGDDLDYPAKLQTEKHANGHTLAPNGTTKAVIPLPSWEKQATWYPTLQTTLTVISQLHDCVKPAILSDIAQEAVIVCAESLTSASQTLATKNPPTSSMHGPLFLVRHLLILKEMTASLDFELTERPPDYKSLPEALNALFRGTSVFTNNVLFNGLGLGGVTESMIDARMQIDTALRRACESLIELCAARAAQPIHDFVQRCTNVLTHTNKLAAKGPVSLTSQDWAKPEKVVEVHDAFKTTCREEIVEWTRNLRLYLENEQTASVLVSPMHSQVVEAYTRFRDLVRTEYSAEVSEPLMSLTELWGYLKETSKTGT